MLRRPARRKARRVPGLVATIGSAPKVVVAVLLLWPVIYGRSSWAAAQVQQQYGVIGSSGSAAVQGPPPSRALPAHLQQAQTNVRGQSGGDDHQGSNTCLKRGDCNHGLAVGRALLASDDKRFENAIIGNVSRPVESLLREKLFKDYDKQVFPWEETGGPAVVRMGLAVQKIISVDLLQGQLSLLVWLRLNWVDPRLSWDAALWNVTVLTISNEYEAETIEVWQPEIVMWNEVVRASDTLHHHQVRLDSDGTIGWSRHGVVHAACNTQGIGGFPYKELSCLMEFGDWVYGPRYVQLYPDESSSIPGVSIGGSDTSLANATTDTYTLKSVNCTRHEYAAYPCCPDESYWPVLWYTFSYQHAENLYTVKIVLSQALLTIIGFTNFWLNPACGERITLAITIPLAAAVYDLLVFEQLPNSNTISFISLFGLISFTISMLVALETAIVIQLHYYDDAAWSTFRGFRDTWRLYAEQRDWVNLLEYLDRRLTTQQNETLKEGGRHRWKHKAARLLQDRVGKRWMFKGKGAASNTGEGGVTATSVPLMPRSPAPRVPLGRSASEPTNVCHGWSARTRAPAGGGSGGESGDQGGGPRSYHHAQGGDLQRGASAGGGGGAAGTSHGLAASGGGSFQGGGGKRSADVSPDLGDSGGGGGISGSGSPSQPNMSGIAGRWRAKAQAGQLTRVASALAKAEQGQQQSDSAISLGVRSDASGLAQGLPMSAASGSWKPDEEGGVVSVAVSGADITAQRSSSSSGAAAQRADVGVSDSDKGLRLLEQHSSRKASSPSCAPGEPAQAAPLPPEDRRSVSFITLVDASVRQNRKRFALRRRKSGLDSEATQALDTALHTHSKKMLFELLQDILDSEASGMKPLQRAILRSLARFDMEHLVNRLVTVLGGSGDREGDGAPVRRGDMDDWSYTADSGPDPRNFRDMVGPEYNRRWRLMGKMVDHVCRFAFPLTYAAAILVVCLTKLL